MSKLSVGDVIIYHKNNVVGTAIIIGTNFTEDKKYIYIVRYYSYCFGKHFITYISLQEILRILSCPLVIYCKNNCNICGGM